MDQPTRPGSTLKRAGWALVAVGIAVIALCVTLGVVKSGPDIARGLTGEEYATPVDRTVDLGAGTYVVFERTPAGSGNAGVTIRPGQVRVVGPDGNDVATGYPSGQQTIERNGRVFTGAVSFHTPTAGRYLIRVDSTQPTSVLISRDIGSLVLAILGWILGAGAGFLLVVAGVIMLIVSATRRGRTRVPAVVPGWYPDPAAPGRQRWWNGQNWVP